MYGKFQQFLQEELKGIRDAGLYKDERVIITPQSADIKVNGGQEVLNFCANNYLGLANSPRLIAAAKKAMDERGYGMSSVRFICGTQDLHKELERKIAEFFGTEDAILYAACFDANGGVFEPLFTDQDAIISDALNHASIIDGVRLCKAKRYRYANGDMTELENCLKEAQAQRFRIIVTDGVFSMDGNVAPLDKILPLAEKYDALVMVDESHSAGVVGKTGRGVTEQFNCRGKVYLGQGFRRSCGRIHHRSQGNHRHAASAFASVPVLQLHSSDGSCCRYRNVQHDQRKQRFARQAAFQYRILRRQDEGSRLRHQAYAIGYLRRDAVRCSAFAEVRCQIAGRRHLRYRFLLPGCA